MAQLDCLGLPNPQVPGRNGLQNPGPHGVEDGLGEALGAEGSAVVGAPKPVCRAAAAPKLLKIATPIPNWSNVMGPIDSAM